MQVEGILLLEIGWAIAFHKLQASLKENWFFSGQLLPGQEQTQSTFPGCPVLWGARGGLVRWRHLGGCCCVERGARRTWKWVGALVVCPRPCLGQWLTVGWEETWLLSSPAGRFSLLSHLAPMVTDFPGTKSCSHNTEMCLERQQVQGWYLLLGSWNCSDGPPFFKKNLRTFQKVTACLAYSV